jgi:hypothetical protein
LPRTPNGWQLNRIAKSFVSSKNWWKRSTICIRRITSIEISNWKIFCWMITTHYNLPTLVLQLK